MVRHFYIFICLGWFSIITKSIVVFALKVIYFFKCLWTVSEKLLSAHEELQSSLATLVLQIRRDRVHYYNYVTLIVFQLLYDWTFFSCIDLSLNGHCALLVICDKSLWIVICFLVLVIWVYQRSVCWVFCCWNDDSGLLTALSVMPVSFWIGTSLRLW